MLYNFFLDKADSRKLELFLYLDNCLSQKELWSVVTKDLDISDFLLNKMIDELNSDFIKYSLENEFEIISDQVNVELMKFNIGSSEELELRLIRESLAFSMTSDIFLSQFISITAYSDNKFLSYSSVYKKLNDMKQGLEGFGFTISKSFEFEGDEKKLRYFLWYLFTKTYNQDLTFYPNYIKEMTLNFISNLEIYRKKPLKENDKIKLSHFLNIAFFRMTDNYFFADEDYYVPEKYLEESCHGTMIIEFLNNTKIAIPQSRLKVEADEILGFLIAKGMLEPMDYLENVSDVTFKEYSHDFIEKTKQAFPRLGLYMDSFSFYNNFSHYATFCNVYIGQRIGNEAIFLLKNFLFHHYLLVLINGKLLEKNEVYIYLYIDFSYGENYTNLVMEVIKKFTDFHIVYQDYIDEKTGLILSDVYFDDFKEIPQVVWKNFPQVIDWQKLVSQIVFLLPQ